MDWSKGGGFPALHKSDFWLLFKKAREQTYISKNIKGAWLGAGLVPYNKLKIFSHLEGPFVSKSQSVAQVGGIQTPKNSKQFRSFMAQTE
jgi:hypothetical protein